MSVSLANVRKVGDGLELWRFTFTPTTIGSNETTAAIPVYKGDIVVASFAVKQVLSGASTNSSVSLGDGGDVDRLVTGSAVIDTETGTAGDIVAGSTATYVYTADDTIDVDYIAGGTPGSIKTVIDFGVLIARGSGKSPY